MQILDSLCKIKDTRLSANRLWDLIRHFSLFLRKMKLNFRGGEVLNRFLAISVQLERNYHSVFAVPLVPTDRRTVQLCGPGKPQLLTNVSRIEDNRIELYQTRSESYAAFGEAKIWWGERLGGAKIFALPHALSV